ncbi:glyoxalase/bleomycin resistance protein/dioxygenase [Catenovulum agarivorans DS-2]|uniref:Glyoxalase/bleomycin resistance protein/dioxygenase n=1 Tax=Catenovulum agarivorans DS-2 TaxID=1328313 RepID=W7QE84_9ALTE|nr:VOC family protein [Catenovulum agarivorans]EWH10231.1 glyoxalase/bleomycin resistance protein/dioxygenase [Catenovulum agarivorans DS-2]
MIGYITLGSNDIDRAGAFYEQIFKIMDVKKIFTDERSIAWAKDKKSVIFTIIRPYNGEMASVGNGTMVALQASSKQQVDQLYAKSLALGASDEGAPGIRSGGFYCAYIRDLDGNKLNFHFNPNAS